MLDVLSFKGNYQQKVQRVLSFKQLMAHFIKAGTQKSIQTGRFHLLRPRLLQFVDSETQKNIYLLTEM